MRRETGSLWILIIPELRVLVLTKRHVGSGNEIGIEQNSIEGEAFCLRMLRRKYFDVTNRWYAPALPVRKSQNGGGLNEFFGDVSLCSLCKRVRKSTDQMVLWSLVESPNQVRFRRPRPKQTLLDLIIWFYQRS